nr:retrovirus-related Pol polyprotein from transposon TNT 1-94 [Tanacetum cinerariifolium]
MQNGRVVVQNVQGRQNKVQGNTARGVVVVDLDEKQLLFLVGGQTYTFDDEVDKGPVQDMGHNKDNIFEADQFYDEDGPSYDSDTLYEVQDHDNCLDNMHESYEKHKIHNVVQPNDFVDSDTDFTSNSNIIPYEQHVQDNKDQVVHSDVSSVPNDVVMIITNDIYEQDAPFVTSNITINASLTTKCARYKELAKDFKQKENKLLKEFLDMNHLKEKVDDMLYKQDQSLQAVHMLCKPKSFYDEVNRVAIGYKNPFYLSKANQVQPALYNSHEIVKPNHACALVHDLEDNLEIFETTRKQMIVLALVLKVVLPCLTKRTMCHWSSRLFRYAKSRPNGKLIRNSIINGPYVRRMIPEPGETNREVPVNETFYVQTDDELTKKELKQIEADDQAIQTILMGLPEDIYAAVDSCETTQKIWLRVQQMMKGSDIGIQEKKANNLKFLNNLQPEWSRHVTIVHQTKDLHIADYTQLYDFLKYNQKEVDELKVERLAKIQDPLKLMETSNNPYAFPAPYQDQPSFNQNYMQQPMPNPEDITDPTTAMNMTLALMAKAFKLNYSTPTNNNQRISLNPHNRQITQLGMNMGQDRQMQMVEGNGENQFRQYVGQNVGNLNGYNAVQNVRNQHVLREMQLGLMKNQIRCYNCRGVGHYARNCTVRPRRRDAAYLQTQLLIAQKEEAGIQLQAEEFDLMTTAADLDEIEEVNENYILMANLQQASTSGAQADKAPVYDSDGSAENNNANISEVTSAEQSGETVEQHPVNFEETRALYDSLYQNLAIEVEKVNSEAAKFVGDFNSLAKEADNSLAKHKALELEIERLLRAVVLNYAKENAQLKATYKNLFDSIFVLRTQTKTTIASLQNALQNTIYENAKLRTQLFKKVSVQKDNKRGTITNTKFAKQSILGKPPMLGETHALSKPVTSNSVPTPQEAKVVKNNKVISLGMFRINPFKASREEKHVPNTVRASARTKPITISQPPVFTKKDVNSDSNGLSFTGINNTKTRRLQPRSNTKNDRVPSVSKRSRSKNKDAEVEDHHRNLLLSKNTKHMSFACNNFKLDSQNVISKVVCAMCKQCLISVNHDVCLRNYVNGKTSRGTIQKANVSIKEKQKKHQPKVKKTKNVGFRERLATPKPKVAFRRNACFVRNLEGVDLLKGDRSTNLYTINLHKMASTSPICLMARASSTKSWLWHQRLSHLNFDTINDLAKNDLVLGIPKFKYHKEHLCPSCEQGKSKRASHPPKPIPNSRQRLHLLHMDLCGPIRIVSINAIATACFTQNRSIIHRRFNKTPYEFINGRKSDISFLHVFGALSYPKNDREDIGKLGAKGDIGFFIGYSADSRAYRIYNRRKKKIMETMNVSFDELSVMAFEQCSSKPGLQSMTSGQISSGLDLTYAPSTITTQQPTEGSDVDELNPNAMFDGNTFVNPLANASTSVVESSSLHNVDPSNMHTFYQPYPHEFQWTKDHPLEQVIGEPSRPVLIRNQLRSDGNMCMYALTVSTVEPKNVKEAMTDPAWIESMQEELLQFKRLDSTSGGAQFLGEKLVSWSSKKQDCTTLLTAKAEYVSLSACCPQVLWMRTQLTDYGFHFNKIPIYCDSKSAIAISCNPVQQSRTKHIVVCYHFIKEHVEKGTIELYFVKTDYQLADLFTKALSADRFNYLVHRLGMRSLSPQELDRLEKSQTFRVIPFSIHNDEWKSFQSQHQTALRKIVTILFTLTVLSALRRSDNENNQDQTMALQPHSSGVKIQDLMLNYQRYIQDESSTSFQDLEHEGGDTSSQGGIRFKDKRYKDLDPRSQACKWIFKRIPKNTRLQVSRSLKKDSQLNDHPLGGDC